jgi:ABC-type lipoprotein export system ATPase subunit
MLRNTVLEAINVWKKGTDSDTASLWVLQGVYLEIMEGDFIAILGGPSTGKSALLKVLSFRETPEQGAVYFEGRLVGRSAKELEQMYNDRVWLLNGAACGSKINAKQQKYPAAILLDEPALLMAKEADAKLLEKLISMRRSGVSIVVATKEPAVASLAPVIYKLSGGLLEKLTGKTVYPLHHE